jgi:antitoxin YefM
MMRIKESPMTILTYTDARNNLASAMDRVVQDRDPAIITRTGREAVVMVAQGEWDAIQETLHLLSSPKNAARLREAIAELDAGGGEIRSIG